MAKKTKQQKKKPERCMLCGRFLSKERGCNKIKQYDDGIWEHE